MQMPGRVFSSGSYRYGFNGKENDNDVKGNGNQQDYGMRIYDPRLGRFLSVDPLTKNYPMLTPYQFASNRPIDGLDLDGLEYMSFHSSMYRLGYVTETTEAPTPAGTICRMTSSRTVVSSVYENIPESIRNPAVKDFLMTSGGPVGVNGEDVSGPYLSSRGRYYNKGPQFWGLGEQSTDISSSSTTGLYNFNSGPDALDANEARASGIASIADAPQHAYGMFMNWFNRDIVQGLSAEYDARKSFYYATNMVDYNIKEGGFPYMSPLLRAQLINFMSDGSLFTDGLNSKSWTIEGLTNALDIANIGVQALSQLGKLQNETRKSVSSLLQTYQDIGGDASRYSTMAESLKIEEE